jgi:hypothetical protein
MEEIVRFVIGGVVVSLFALLGDLFKPRTFGGLFGAAPSIALATLGLTIHNDGRLYAAIEGRSMLLGAVGLLAYSLLVSILISRFKFSVPITACSGILVWFVCAFGLWLWLLR